jgi:DNA replication licensing factor MCM7
LRLSETISHEDVDEAIRLTHASKASLTDDAKSDPREDYISAIFSIMRDFAAQQGTTITAGSIECRLNYSQIEAMVLRKGFTAQQLSHCITEYSQLGVLSLEHDGSYIIFDYQ